jgi:hypothetical protein
MVHKSGSQIRLSRGQADTHRLARDALSHLSGSHEQTLSHPRTHLLSSRLCKCRTHHKPKLSPTVPLSLRLHEPLQYAVLDDPLPVEEPLSVTPRLPSPSLSKCSNTISAPSSFSPSTMNVATIPHSGTLRTNALLISSSVSFDRIFAFTLAFDEKYQSVGCSPRKITVSGIAMLITPSSSPTLPEVLRLPPHYAVDEVEHTRRPRRLLCSSSSASLRSQHQPPHAFSLHRSRSL